MIDDDFRWVGSHAALLRELKLRVEELHGDGLTVAQVRDSLFAAVDRLCPPSHRGGWLKGRALAKLAMVAVLPIPPDDERSMMPTNDPKARMSADPGCVPPADVVGAEAEFESALFKMVEGMTDLTIAVLRSARSVDEDGESECVARLEILDRADPSFQRLSGPIRAALESHIRRVVAEFFEGRRESWEG